MATGLLVLVARSALGGAVLRGLRRPQCFLRRVRQAAVLREETMEGEATKCEVDRLRSAWMAGQKLGMRIAYRSTARFLRKAAREAPISDESRDAIRMVADHFKKEAKFYE